MTVIEVLIACGIPATIFSAILGIVAFFFKRYLDRKDREREAREKKRDEREKLVEVFMRYMMKDIRSTNIVAVATAKAVQRIPDAHCNGDMKEALEKAAAVQNEEKDFIFDQGIDHIFGSR